MAFLQRRSSGDAIVPSAGRCCNAAVSCRDLLSHVPSQGPCVPRRQRRLGPKGASNAGQICADSRKDNFANARRPVRERARHSLTRLELPMPRARMSLLFVALLAAALLVSPTAQSASSDIVVSQLYAGGGNSGAIFTNDFVELFNRGAAA